MSRPTHTRARFEGTALRRLAPVPIFASFAALGSMACSDDMIESGRADTGVGPSDSSVADSLALEVGMTFSYQAIMTYRDSANGAERNSLYTIKLQIESVDDRRGNGDSSLAFLATESSTDNDDWDEARDYDSWVGRAGPSRETDQLGVDPVIEMLSEPPSIPPAPTPSRPKTIPPAGTFFLDMRGIETIRSEFVEAHIDSSPQAVAPEQNAGRWRLAFSGMDSTIVYYSPELKRRAIALEYDPRGFLVRLEETIGTSMLPRATCSIQLTAGPGS